MKKIIVAVCLLNLLNIKAEACTGISLKDKTGAPLQARTIEWGENELQSNVIVIPRDMEFQSYTPDKGKGFKWKGKYGAVGISLVNDGFIGEGINEKGLNAGVFYFTRYGSLHKYNPKEAKESIMDMELTKWFLTSFETVDEVEGALKKVKVVPVAYFNGEAAPTGHWRVADRFGNVIVVEIVNNGEVKIYKNTVGVITNSPDYSWQMTNLNNYVNLRPGNSPSYELGNDKLMQFGAGSGMLGLPGDITPPSRFVRAAFYVNSAPVFENENQMMKQAFHILNNFDIPIGIEYGSKEHIPSDLQSATQWTAASDQKNMIFYYKTMFNSQIRKIDLKTIDFNKKEIKVLPLDKKKEENIENVII